jgi:hypothetical protein
MSLSRSAGPGSASHVSAIVRYSCSAARSPSKDKDLCACIGLCLCQAKPPSHTTQPLNIRFGIGFMVALVLPLSNAQWLIYKMELPTCLRQACMYARSGGVVGVCSYGVPLGSRRRGSWLPYICMSSCHSSFLVVWWFRPFLHSTPAVMVCNGLAAETF